MAVWSRLKLGGSLHRLFGRLFMICLVALVRVHRSLEAPQVISMPAQEISVGGRFALGPGRLLHEGRVLLEEGWGYSAGVGGSCSTHNRRSVDPHPRGVGRLEAGRDSADVEPPPGGCAGTRREPEPAGPRSGWGRRGRPLGRERPARPPRPRRTSRSRAPQQLSVHGADISGPAVEVPSGNRWNSAVLSWIMASEWR